MDDSALATQRLTRARSLLLLDHPWFGALSLRLKMVGDAKIPTMCTDGTELRFNAQWVSEQTDAALIGVVAHEVMHCALLHPYRMVGRDHQRWNVACDLSINALLKEQGLTLPEGALLDKRFDGKAAEDIYALLPEKTPQSSKPQPGMEPAPKSNGDQPGKGQDQGNGDQDSDSQDEGMTAVDWMKAAEEAAAVAKKAGKLSADVDRAIHGARQSKTDWRDLLRRFIEQTVPRDYTWATPNRRFVAEGIYLPGTIKENMPKLGVAVDTSGSISGPLLEMFAAELTAILQETHPIAVHVVYCDASVKGQETFTPEDGAIKLHAKGGGGTAFQPALDVFTKSDEPPAAVIYLTDLEGPAPKVPDYPVLWAVPEGYSAKAPFGERVTISKEPQ